MRHPALRAALLACVFSAPGVALADPASQSAWITLPIPGQGTQSVIGVVPMCVTGSAASTGPGYAVLCGTYGTAAAASGTGGGTSSGGSAPTGTVGTAATGSGAASPVFDAKTGLGLLTAGTALPAGTNTIGTVNIGTQPVPAGASTSANQTTEITALQAIQTNTAANNATSANQQTQITAEQTTANAQGAPATAAVQPTGGSGSLGWLSGIYTRLGTALGVFQPDVRAAGTLAAATVGATYVVPVANGQNVVGFQITGLAASGAVLATQVSGDGATWQAVNNNSAGNGNVGSPVSVDGAIKINAGGHQAVRLVVVTAGTGTITVASTASVAAGLVSLSSSLPAGTNQIGTVLSGGVTIGSGYQTPTLASTAAYAAGQAVGGVLTFPAMTRTGATTGSVTKALVTFADTQTPSLDLLLFSSAPTSTVTDHTTLSLSAADNARVTTVVHVTDCTSTGTPTLCQAADMHREFVLPAAGAPLYGVLVTRGAFTPASTTDVAAAVVGVSD